MKKKFIYCVIVLFIIILFLLSLSLYCSVNISNNSYTKENIAETIISRQKYEKTTCPPFSKNPLNSDPSINYDIVDLYSLPSFSQNNFNSAIACINIDSLKYTDFLSMLRLSEDPFERGIYYYLKLESTYFLTDNSIEYIQNESTKDSSPFVHSIVYHWLDINNLIEEKNIFIKEIADRVNQDYISIVLDSLESWVPGDLESDKSMLVTMIYNGENINTFEKFLGQLVKESVFIKESLIKDFWNREIRDYPNSLAADRLRRTNTAKIIYYNVPEEKYSILLVLTDKSELMSIRREVFNWYLDEKGKNAFKGDIADYFKKNTDDPMADYYNNYKKEYSWYKQFINCLNFY